MTDKQQTMVVRLEAMAASVELTLLLEVDGTLLPKFEPFLTIGSLYELWDLIMYQMGSGAVIDQVDCEAMCLLMSFLISQKTGLQLLKVLQEYERSQTLAVDKLLRAERTIEKLASTDPKSMTESLERQGRRAKQALTKKT
ncbi:hypothetical protein KW846_03030 [Pseudomonas sp. PDM32]|uniref:hypothetical protein n=1 Tax=Pseudomonas sp. PDM32 TaxID=2854768 RepID=UPI001C4492C0|nr:hypothetical protein [Pseudomonas sp. PDM32]MBV7571667.1 hypothetical protein [Pseudomonas sp. PDM32]